jgi:HlyD family secretion protein
MKAPLASFRERLAHLAQGMRPRFVREMWPHLLREIWPLFVRMVRPARLDEADPLRAIRTLNRIGIAVVILLVGGFGGWAATSELSGAVIAHGTVVVESNVKKVQHPTGGVVGEILVHDGSEVTAGQVLIRLDDTVTRSTLGVVRSQLDELLARQARLLAERDGADSISFPDDIMSRRTDKSVAAAIAGEQRLFEARRSARSGQRAQLRERIVQSNEEIRGLTSQQDGKEQEVKLIGQELEGVSQLYTKNLVSISRLTQLQRDKARLLGEQGQYVAEIARARGKISETELQILQLDQDFRTDVLKDLRETEGKVAELKERVTAAVDQLKRVDIRAPQDGFVNQLAVHTVGGVVGTGETLMQIVPRADALVVEAKVAPQDIDQVAVGAAGIVRILAGDQRTSPDLNARLTRVSADLTRDPGNSLQENQPYYLVRLSLPADEVRRLGDLKLVPGMPAEVFIQTYARTPLQYLLKPLREQIARTFRER